MGQRGPGRASGDAAHYETPEVVDHGTLGDMTLACMGSGSEDGIQKSNSPFIHSTPDFGNPGFCATP